MGFSCYLWNVERSLRLCRSIRQRIEGTRIVPGGHEVSPYNGLLAHASFEAAVHGEGEETFSALPAAWFSTPGRGGECPCQPHRPGLGKRSIRATGSS